MDKKEKLIAYFDKLAAKRDKWKKRNWLYHKTLKKFYTFSIPEGSSVLELGCGTGDLLAAVKPGRGLGVDFSPKMIDRAIQKHADLEFICQDVENLAVDEKFDYIIISDLLTSLLDVQLVLKNLKKVTHRKSKIVISTYNYHWEPFLRLGELFFLKAKQPLQNWLTHRDINNLLDLENLEEVKLERKLMFPKYIPIIHFIFNKVLANLPFFGNMSPVNFIVARPAEPDANDYSVSILVPARNEKGNIENAILRTPKFGSKQQFIFVEGNSSDNTWEEIQRVKKKYANMDIITLKQSGKGKGNAVREGFDQATCDILMILDADLTTPPEDMPKFYEALASNKCDFVNGCRLVYPMESQAMRFLNFLGNKFFGWFFSYLLSQRLKDTLCGTKVLFKEDYHKIVANRSYFGDFDPFGDFDLLFGAAKLNFKIKEVLVRYRDREYGSTQISRFKHGWLLIKMSFFAAFKLKFK